MTSTYRRTCQKLQGLDDYECLDRLDRLEVFESYVRDLEKEYLDQTEAMEAQEKRQYRKNRDAFKDLLQKHVEEGRINAKTRWKEYLALIGEEEAYRAVDSNKLGSRPRELFEDVIEKLEEEYEKDRALMKEVYRGSSIVVSTGTSLEEFKNAMESQDERMKDCNPLNVEIIYNELHAKASDREMREVRRKKRACDEFMSLLKRSEQVTDATTWEEVKELFADRLESRFSEEYKETLQEFQAKLRKKMKKERPQESSSGDERRHRHSRHHRRTKHDGDSEEGALEGLQRPRKRPSADEVDPGKPRKHSKRDKRREKKRDREKHLDKSESKHKSQRKKQRKGPSRSKTHSPSSNNSKHADSVGIGHSEELQDAEAAKEKNPAQQDMEITSVEEGEAPKEEGEAAQEEGEAVDSPAEEGEL